MAAVSGAAAAGAVADTLQNEPYIMLQSTEVILDSGTHPMHRNRPCTWSEASLDLVGSAFNRHKDDHMGKPLHWNLQCLVYFRTQVICSVSLWRCRVAHVFAARLQLVPQHHTGGRGVQPVAQRTQHGGQQSVLLEAVSAPATSVLIIGDYCPCDTASVS